MIALTRLNFESVLLNSDLIETVETTPDTVIRLTNGQKLIVRETAGEVLEKVREFRISIAGRRASGNSFPPVRESGELAGEASPRPY